MHTAMVLKYFSLTHNLYSICNIVLCPIRNDDNMKILNNSATKFGYSIISTIMKEAFQSVITTYPLIKYAYVLLLTSLSITRIML